MQYARADRNYREDIYIQGCFLYYAKNGAVYLFLFCLFVCFFFIEIIEDGLSFVSTAVATRAISTNVSTLELFEKSFTFGRKPEIH